MKRSLLLAPLLALVVATPVLAARTVLDAPDGAHFGDTITLTVSGNSADEAWARVNCYVAGQLVLDAFAYLGDDPAIAQGPEVTLGPTSLWSGGGAECVAQMWSTRRWRPLPALTDTFAVAP